MFIQGKESETPNTIALFAAILAFVLRDIIFVDSFESRTREIFPKDGTPIKELFVSGFIILFIGCTFLPGKNLNIADSLAVVLVGFYIWASGGLLYRAGDELIEASLDDNTNGRIREMIDKTQGVTDSEELKPGDRKWNSYQRLYHCT
jgi:divalent metal cation (Fe/Co/Zn/Cd) transporter